MLTYKEIAKMAVKENVTLNEKSVKAMFDNHVETLKLELEKAKLALRKAKANANVDEFYEEELRIDLRSAIANAKSQKAEIKETMACELAKLSTKCSPSAFVNKAVDANYLSEMPVESYAVVERAQARLDDYLTSVSEDTVAAQKAVDKLEDRIAAAEATKAALFAG